MGNRVRASREALSVSLEALGKATGRSYQQIQKCETGQNRISASALWEIARQLGVPVSFFFEGME